MLSARRTARTTMPTYRTTKRTCLWAASALALLVFAEGAAAQSGATVGAATQESPFAQLEGSWSGAGTIDLANGQREPIKCRASYDVLENQNKLQLNLNCASESYKFDLRASAAYAAGSISGNWSEATRNAAGTLSGKVEGAGFRVVAKGPAFDADLDLVTKGDTQAVSIRSQDQQSSVRGATITLRRG